MNKKYFYLGFALSLVVILDSPAAELQKNVSALKFQSNVLNDLNVFRAQGKDSKATLFAAIDRTSTVTGGESLKQKVAHPKVDIAELMKNQEFSKKLLEDEKMLEFLDDVIKSVDDTKVIAGLKEKDPVTQQAYDNLYPANDLPIPLRIKKKWNTNETALHYGQAFGFLPTIAGGFTLLAFSWCLYEEAQGFSNVNFSNNARIQIILTAGFDLGRSLYYDVQDFRKRKVVFKDIEPSVVCVARLINALKKIHDYGKENSDFAQSFAGYSKLDAFFNKKLPVVNLLKDKAGTGASVNSLSKGVVLAGNTLIQDSKQDLQEALQLHGDIDAAVSIAKLVKESKGNRVGYSFAEYVEADKPSLKLDNFWHPQVDKEKAVTNSLELGGNQNHHGMLVTGSNTGGKSTVLKAAVANVWLAQTIGVAPASRAQLTPFTYIDSSMNIVDDTAGGDSLYKAEVRRIQSIDASTKALQNKQFGFVVIDEMFRGTSPDEAEIATYDCTKELMAVPNVLPIVATHFKKQVVNLENESNGTCKNYRVDLVKNPDGSLSRPFKLKPGVSEVNAARELLNEAFGRPVNGDKK